MPRRDEAQVAGRRHERQRHHRGAPQAAQARDRECARVEHGERAREGVEEVHGAAEGRSHRRGAPQQEAVRHDRIAEAERQAALQLGVVGERFEARPREGQHPERHQEERPRLRVRHGRGRGGEREAQIAREADRDGEPRQARQQARPGRVLAEHLPGEDAVRRQPDMTECRARNQAERGQRRMRRAQGVGRDGERVAEPADQEDARSEGQLRQAARAPRDPEEPKADHPAHGDQQESGDAGQRAADHRRIPPRLAGARHGGFGRTPLPRERIRVSLGTQPCMKEPRWATRSAVRRPKRPRAP